MTWFAVGAWGHRVRDVAKAVDKHAGSVSRRFTQLTAQARDNPGIRRQLDDLAKTIAALKPTM